IAHGYERNRDSFPFLECHFTLRYGKASNLEDALSARLTSETSMDGLWLVNGKKVKFQLMRSPTAKPLRTLDDIQNSYPGLLWLSTGPHSLNVDADLSMGNLHSPENPGLGTLHTPFDFGVMGYNEEANPARQIRKCLQEKLPCRLLPNRQVNGRPV